MGMETGGGPQCVLREMGREVRTPIEKMKLSQALHVNGVTAEMLKCGVEAGGV